MLNIAIKPGLEGYAMPRKMQAGQPQKQSIRHERADPSRSNREHKPSRPWNRAAKTALDDQSRITVLDGHG